MLRQMNKGINFSLTVRSDNDSVILSFSDCCVETPQKVQECEKRIEDEISNSISIGKMLNTLPVGGHKSLNVILRLVVT